MLKAGGLIKLSAFFSKNYSCIILVGRIFQISSAFDPCQRKMSNNPLTQYLLIERGGGGLEKMKEKGGGSRGGREVKR